MAENERRLKIEMFSSDGVKEHIFTAADALPPPWEDSEVEKSSPENSAEEKEKDEMMIPADTACEIIRLTNAIHEALYELEAALKIQRPGREELPF